MVKAKGIIRSTADAAAPSTPVRGTVIAGFLSRSLYVTAEALVVAGVIVQIFVFTKRLTTPVDVSGALFGGVGGPMDVVGWMVALGGVLVVALLRLPGFRVVWIMAGGLPIGLGALALWHYPFDYGGNLIVSPQRSEIVFLMVLGGAFLALGAILHRYVIVPTLSSRWLSTALRLLAMVGMAALFVALPIVQQVEKHRPPLPPCAHDSAGRQLTLCL